MIKRERLTEATIKKLPRLDKRYRVHDTEVKGLFVQVQTTGHKSFKLQYRPKGKNPIAVSLGDCAMISAAAARLRAKNIQAKVWTGDDPYLIKKSLESEMTLHQLAEEYLKVRRFKPKTLEHIKSCFECWLLDKNAAFRKYINYSIKDKRISKINLKELKQIHNQIGLKSKYTANRTIKYLRAMFNYAIENGYLKINPVAFKARDFFEEKQSNQIFSEEKRERIMQAAFNLDHRTNKINYRYYQDNDLDVVASVAIYAALAMGRRYKSEILNLRWDQINWDLKKVYYDDTKVGQKNYSIPERAINLFETIQRSRNELVHVKGKMYKTKKIAPTTKTGPWRTNDDRREYIFPSAQYPNRSSAPYLQEVRATWKRLLEMCNINYLPLKQARHSLLTLLYRKTKNLEVVRQYAGHTDIKTTMRYLKLADVDVEKGLNELDKDFKTDQKVIRLT